MPANVALAALVIVRLLISIRPSASTPVAAIAPVVPAFRAKSNAPTPSVMMPPKLMPAPAGVPPTLVLSTVLLESNVTPSTPPVPKSRSTPGLRIKPPMLLGALFVKFMPPLNKNVSVPATSPIVTRPPLR